MEAALTNIELHLTHLGQIDVSLAREEQLALASLSEPAFIDNLIQTTAEKIAQALINKTSTLERDDPYQLLKGIILHTTTYTTLTHTHSTPPTYIPTYNLFLTHPLIHPHITLYTTPSHPLIQPLSHPLLYNPFT